MSLNRFTVLAVAASTMIARGVFAASIPVVNAGFEDPILADASHTGGMPVQVPGWTATSAPDGLVFNPGTGLFSAEAPEGSNILFADGRYDAWQTTAKISQTGLTTISGTQQYELRVKVGQNATSTLFGDYTISLTADGVAAASVSNFGGGTGATPAPDHWVDVTLNYTPAPGDVGKSLGIRLETGVAGTADAGSYAWFDDVRLSSVEVPEPASVLCVVPLLAAMRRRRSR